jgi:hypothetical protein
VAVCAATASAPCSTSEPSARRTPPSILRATSGVEHLQEGIEIAVARSSEERVDDTPLLREVTVGLRRVAQAAPGAAGELLGGRFGAIERGGDVGERHGEHVVQHKREPLGGTERVEHHQQRQTYRLGQKRLVFRVILLKVDDGIRDVHRELLASRCARAQHVQAHPPDDRRQPGPHVLNCRGILVANPQPRLLQGIVGFADRPEHPLGDPAEMPSVLLEPFGQPLALFHGQLGAPVMTVTSGCGRQGRW